MRLFLAWMAAPLLLSAALTVGAKDAPVYEGRLFETHAHEDNQGFAAGLVPAMDRHGVERSVHFVPMDPDDPADTHEVLRESMADHPGRFTLFFHVNPQSPQDIRPARLEAVRAFAPADFRGFGETALYRPPWQSHGFEQDPWPAVLAWAADHGLVVMIHLRPGQEGELERMLDAHGDAPVLLHGPEYVRDLPALLAEHPNLWFTLDTASLLRIDNGPDRLPTVLMYPHEGQGEDFVPMYDANRESMLEAAWISWLPVLAAAPERVMWGTDVSFDWHARAEVYDRLLEFSRLFIGGLPDEYQDGFAWENAFGLLGGGVTLEPFEGGPDGLPGPGATLAAGAAALAAALASRRRAHA